MKAILFAFLLFFSIDTYAHGSSHPSCEGLHRDDIGYENCRERQRDAERRREQACMASPECVAERKREEHIMMGVVGLIFAALLSVPMAALFSLISDYFQKRRKK